MTINFVNIFIITTSGLGLQTCSESYFLSLYITDDIAVCWMHLEGVCYVGTNPEVGFPARELRLITTCHLVNAHYTMVVWTRFI
jgi:hypothetical protein